ncbi:glycosyltransferase [Mesoflavibacter sp.]|uniref:glycosyltransferase n=1 Tax=Mesoflavibacter sp. TaxID=1930902 RepID=UPI00351512E1
MKILLVGEYSRLHNSLKEGLTELGHDVTIMASGDGFKNYPVDIKINHSFNNFFLKKLKVLIYKLTKIDLGAFQMYIKAKSNLKTLGNFDVVQLINESPLKITTKYEIKLINSLSKQTKKIYLLSCGIDYTCMKYMINGGFKYSIMTPYLNDKSLKNRYRFQLMYLSKPYKRLHDFILTKCNGIISSDIDYHIPFLKKEKYLGLIPNAVNSDKIHYIPISIEKKIKIFHGVNKFAYHKKGNLFFDDAISILKDKYPDKVEVFRTENIPYKDYIKLYDSCHILLDQVYGYDQGYNALEAMAKGKVVFTGAEQEWLDHYDLEEDTVAINALPDVNYLVKKLEWLIENPEQINKISKNARQFIETHHDYKEVAKQYLATWHNN